MGAEQTEKRDDNAAQYAEKDSVSRSQIGFLEPLFTEI